MLQNNILIFIIVSLILILANDWFHLIDLRGQKEDIKYIVFKDSELLKEEINERYSFLKSGIQLRETSNNRHYIYRAPLRYLSLDPSIFSIKSYMDQNSMYLDSVDFPYLKFPDSSYYFEEKILGLKDWQSSMIHLKLLEHSNADFFNSCGLCIGTVGFSKDIKDSVYLVQGICESWKTYQERYFINGEEFYTGYGGTYNIASTDTISLLYQYISYNSEIRDLDTFTQREFYDLKNLK